MGRSVIPLFLACIIALHFGSSGSFALASAPRPETVCGSWFMIAVRSTEAVAESFDATRRIVSNEAIALTALIRDDVLQLGTADYALHANGAVERVLSAWPVNIAVSNFVIILTQIEDRVSQFWLPLLEQGVPVQVPRPITAAAAAGRSVSVLASISLAFGAIGTGVAISQLVVSALRSILGDFTANVAASFPCCFCYLACGLCGPRGGRRAALSERRRAALLRDSARGKKAMAEAKRQQVQKEAASDRRRQSKAAVRELRQWAIAQGGGLDEGRVVRELEAAVAYIEQSMDDPQQWPHFGAFLRDAVSRVQQGAVAARDAGPGTGHHAAASVGDGDHGRRPDADSATAGPPATADGGAPAPAAQFFAPGAARRPAHGRRRTNKRKLIQQR